VVESNQLWIKKPFSIGDEDQARSRRRGTKFKSQSWESDRPLCRIIYKLFSACENTIYIF